MEDYVLFTTMDTLQGGKVEYSITVNGRAKKAYAKWSIGGGSSGAYSEYRDRLIFALARLPMVREATTTPTAEDDAAHAADVAESAAAELADALGL